LGTVRLRAVEHVYDWTYTRDQAEAVRRLLAAHSLPHTEYNLSGGTLWRLSEVIAALEALIPGARFVAAGPGEAADLDLGEPYRRGPLSIERLRRDTGFAPAYDLERGLRAALPWWAQMVHAS
jgi:UDP-glucose 4-epimerase